jgi:CHASE2 domain-containing sensor protein
MEFAYRPEAWETMFEMVALASVTLTGLLFVGLSINLRSIVALNGATVAIAIAGLGLVMRSLGGFLWLVPTILTCLLWSTYNAWSLLTRGMEIDA